MHHLVVQLSQMEHGGDMLLARGLSPKLSVKGAIVLTELAFPAHHSRQAQQRRNYDMGGIGTWQELSRRVPVIRWLNRGYKTVARRGASATTCGLPEGCETAQSLASAQARRGGQTPQTAHCSLLTAHCSLLTQERWCRNPDLNRGP
jgi:hypothetical protein